MAAQTGRTVAKWFKFQVDDSAGTLRDIPVNSINGVGLTFEEIDLTAFQDAVKGALAGQPDFVLTVGGPFDNLAAQAASGSAAAAALSGSHTVLNAINGASTPLTFGCYFGVRHYWETGEPAFGITSTATNGAICFEYTVDPANMTYSAKFRMAPGSAAPAWGTAAYT
jgi:hypothetical protein